ncbi:MAG: WG repeat-containing protein [Candidatus Kapaibacteriota bacterium]
MANPLYSQSTNSKTTKKKSPAPQKKEIQKPLIAYLKDNKWYFLDQRGNLLFAPLELLDVLGYSEGYFRVNMQFNQKPKWAIIDLKGNITVIDGINYLFNFHNSRALVVKLKKRPNTNDTTTPAEQVFGYINYEGKLVIPLIYEDATEFSEGLAFVKNKDIRGFIDTNNRLVIKLENIAGNTFKNGIADVNDKNFLNGFIDKRGKIVIPLEYNLLEHYSEGLAFAIKGDTFGFINMQNKFEFYVDAYVSKPFTDGVAFVGKLINQKMKWALINRKGEKITDYIFDDVKEFSEGVAPVQKDGKWFFIDKNGYETLSNDYRYIDKFVDGLAWASLRNGKRGYIDHNGNFIIELPEAEVYFDFRLNRKVY